MLRGLIVARIVFRECLSSVTVTCTGGKGQSPRVGGSEPFPGLLGV